MNDYKVIQLITFFVTRFNYKIMSFGKNIDPTEVFLFNNDRKNYQLIRISSNGMGSMFFNPEGLKLKIETVKRFTRCTNADVLNILVCQDEPEGTEVINTVCLDTNYAKGSNLLDAFPGIYAVIHDVDNPEMEIKDLYLQINKAQEAVRKAHVKTKINSKVPYLTYIFMALGFIGYLCTMFLPYGTSLNAILIGINYKTLVCVNNEFYRCILSTFISTDFFTMALNLLCLYFVGKSVEGRIGHLAYAVTFILSGFFGNILWCIFGANYFLSGMSSAIDGIFAIIVIQAIIDGSIMRNKLFLLLIVLNVFSISQSGAYAVTSIGGVVVGTMMYFMLVYKDDKVVFYNFIGSLCVLVLLMCYKASTVRDISPVYKGVDLQYVSIVDDLGFHKYSANLYNKLINFYGGK